VQARNSRARSSPSSLTRAVFWVAVALFVGERLWNISAYDLSGDETLSIEIVSHSMAQLFPRIVTDLVHPPLFYLLLKSWIFIGGTSLVWLKLFPVLISILTLAPFILLCRSLTLEQRAVNLALALVAVNSYLVYYSQEVRMYSLLLFFTLFSLWLFREYLRSENRGYLIALGIANLLLVYTHFFGWLVVVAEWALCLQKRRRFIEFAFLTLALGALFSPWVYLASASMATYDVKANLGWIPPANVHEVAGYYAVLAGPSESSRGVRFGLLLFATPIAFHIGQLFSRKKSINDAGDALNFWFLVAVAAIPVVIAILASQVLPVSVWYKRYLIITAVPTILAVSVAVARITPRWLRVSLVAVILTWSAVGSLQAFSPRFQWSYLVGQVIQLEKSATDEVVIYCSREESKPQSPITSRSTEQRGSVLSGSWI